MASYLFVCLREEILKGSLERRRTRLAMITMSKLFLYSRLMAAFGVCLPSTLLPAFADEAPQPYGAVPTPAQLAWHDMEMYAFAHFSTNTFTGKEWGYGDESPTIFNPTNFEADQIVNVLADAGFKGLIVTAKHHDGFCLWPTKTTRHSVASSPWKNGKGDVVGEFAKACQKRGIKFGVYLSPWDRNHPAYGTPKYISVYRAQLRELLENYGDLFEVWFDGANGGDGFYGGKRERRSIDRSTYYDWPITWKMVGELQPHAVIFSDVGPGCRWVGNERGVAGYPCWATYSPRTSDGSSPAPGHCDIGILPSGTNDGKFWIPAEADVSIRPGWFWRASENAYVRTPDNLMDLYFCSVGRGACLNLNVPPDQRGLIHENDAASLKVFGKLLRQMYSKNYASGARVHADSERSDSPACNVLKPGRKSFWMAQNGRKTGTLTLELPEESEWDVIRLAEPIQLGQRIRRFSVEVWLDGRFVPWVEGSSIGPRVLLQGSLVKTQKIRVRIDQADAEPALCEVSLWKRPVVMKAPTMSRNKEGIIKLAAPAGLTIRYTLDGSEPGPQSPIYRDPISLPNGGRVAARSFRGMETSEVVSEEFPVETRSWKVISAENQAADPARAIDGDERSLWHTHAASGELPPPQSIVVDMGRTIPVAAVYYVPRRDGTSRGTVKSYELCLSQDGKHWGKPVAQGEFSNIQANPVRQKIVLAQPIPARFFRFTAKDAVEGNHIVVAELGVQMAY